MQFNEIATKTGLIQDSEQRVFGDEGYGRISGDTNLLFQFTNRFNRALDRFAYLSLTADGRWEVDDTNYTTLSIGRTNLVSGQSQYGFSATQLEIEKVLVKDLAGDLHVLTAAGINDQNANSFLTNTGDKTGLPTRYFKRGESLFLDVIPDWDMTAGLIVYFKRGPSYFVYTDTTKEPGIPSLFHSYISLHADAEYGLDRNMAEAKNWYTRLQEKEKEITVFYSTRAKDDKPKMRVLRQNNR